MGSQKTSAKAPAKPTSKAPAKLLKKGSKLASLKSLMFGGSDKKKKDAPKVTLKKVPPAKAVAPKAVPAKAAAKAVVAKEVKTKSAKAGALVKSTPVAAVKAAKGKAAAAAQRAANLDAEGDTVCREVACEGLATSAGYCRLHYIKNWKKIKRKELILREKKLNQYIEELVAKYPDKYIEAIRQDLANDKDFAKVIHDLDLDESVDDFDVEGESVDSLIDTIKRDFDDEGEAF